jgi:hypothetical protein
VGRHLGGHLGVREDADGGRERDQEAAAEREATVGVHTDHCVVLILK